MAQAVPVEDRIVVDPAVLVGKPAVKGTRIAVETVLAKLASNPSVEDLLAAYPRLSLEDVKACLAFASRQVKLDYKASESASRKDQVGTI